MSIFFYFLGAIEGVIGLFFAFGDNVPSVETKLIVLSVTLFMAGILVAIGLFISGCRKR